MDSENSTPKPSETPPEAPRAVQSPNRLAEGSMTTAGIVMVTALLVMVNYLALRHYKRFDLTAGQLYTLSEKSKTVIADVDQDIDIILLLHPNSELYTAADEMVDRVVAANPRYIERRDLDASRDRIEVERLIERHDIRRNNVIVVAAAHDKRIIGEYELTEYDYSGAEHGEPPTLTAFKGEQQIVSALLSLQETDKPKILFTAGHGEAPLAPGGARSFSQAREILGGDNFDVQEWRALGSENVPDGTDLMVIAGPTTNFLPPELETLDRYLKRGGRVLVFADPVLDADATGLKELGLEDWLSGYGARLGRDLVVDPSSELPLFGPDTLFTDHYGDHPIVEAPRQTGTRTLMPMVRSVSAEAQNPAEAVVEELILTSDEGWGETGFDRLPSLMQEPDDLPGPVSVAVAVSLPTTPSDAEPGDAEPDDEPDRIQDQDEARMVIFGDVDWATDAQVANGANGMILLNTFNWLVQRERLIDIEAKAPKQSRLTLLDGELSMLYALFVLALPGLAACAGVWIALQRRR